MKPTVQQMIALEMAEVGYKETPVNYTKYNDEYYGKRISAPWCMNFQQIEFIHAELPLPKKTDSCTTFMNWCKAHGCWIEKGPFKAGDVAIVQNPGSKHAVFLRKVYVNGADTIEGNWNDQVSTYYRPFDERFLGAYRPDYAEEEPDMTPAEVQEMIDAALDKEIVRYHYLKDVPLWYKPTIQRLVNEGSLAGKGGSGETLIVDLTEDMCRVLVVEERHENIQNADHA